MSSRYYIGIYHNSYVMLEFFLTLRCYSFRAPIGISKTVQIWLKNSTWINMCSFFQNILKIWLGLLSGEFSVRQAQSKVVKIKHLDFSCWTWSTPWGHVLILKTFCRNPVLIAAHELETNSKFDRLKNWVPDCSAHDRISAEPVWLKICYF